MFKQNIKLFFRNIKKYKGSFLINVLGLSTGLASTLLIYLWVYDELKVDKFHKNDGQLYQVMLNYHFPDGLITDTASPATLETALVEEMPEVEYATAINSRDISCEGFLSHEDNHIKGSGLYAGRDFFHIFSYNLTQGDSKQVLADNNAIVISERLAIKLFGTTENVIGKTIEGSPELFGETFQVSGVFAPPPSSSTLQFDFIINFELLAANTKWVTEWTGDGAKVYIILKKGTNIDHFNKKIVDYLILKSPDRLKSTLFVRKYSSGYLYGQYENGVQAGGRIVYVRVFSIIALLILVIACINFMNLSTARASRKMKEIGIKKAIGANKKMLVVQFLGESMLISLLSFVVASVLVVLLLPQFNEITGKHLDLNIGTNVVLSSVGIIIFTGLVSGSYPAFYLSGFNPISVLKGRRSASSGEQWVRKGLVIVQFTISVIFIVVVLIMNKQIEFTQTKNLGYSKNNILHFQMKEGYGYSFETFMSELRSLPGVVNATNIYGGNIVENVGGGTGFSWEGMAPGSENIEYLRLEAGYDLIETLGFELIQGRSFSREYSTEREKLIVNKAAAEMIGTKDIVNKTIRDIRRDKQIIGVVNNFNVESLHKEIRPCFIRFEPNGDNVMVKLKTGEETATIGKLEKLYEKFHLGYPLEFTFLDDDYQTLYVSEYRAVALSKYLTGLAILISCLGLFGLAAFAAERRRKEISIRKVLGQSVSQITIMLSGEFAKLVLISTLIALPIAYALVNDWLSGFAYRILLQVWYFLGAGLIALSVAMLTVGSHAIRAANKNPVEALREE